MTYDTEEMLKKIAKIKAAFTGDGPGLAEMLLDVAEQEKIKIQAIHDANEAERLSLETQRSELTSEREAWDKKIAQITEEMNA